MTRFCCLPHWTVAAALTLVGLVATGCDGGPTWNETDPAVGPEDPDVMTGTIESEGGVVYGPDSSAVGTADGTLIDELGFEIQQVPIEEINANSLPDEIPAVGAAAYKVASDEDVVTSLDAPPAAVSIPIPDRISPEGLSVAVKHPRGLEFDQSAGTGQAWQLQNGVLGEQRDQITVTTQSFFSEGTTYVLIRSQPAVFSGTLLGQSTGSSSSSKASSTPSPGFYTVCWGDTFESSDPCDALEPEFSALRNSILPKAHMKIKEAGYGRPLIDRCRATISDLFEECSRKNGPYEITVVGVNYNAFSGTGEYKRNTASVYVKGEEKKDIDGDSNKELRYRNGKNIHASAIHETIHAFQYGSLSRPAIQEDEFGKSRHYWVTEGHAELAAKSLMSDRIVPSYLERSPFIKGNLALDSDGSPYKRQDFWAFVAREDGVRDDGPYGLGFSITYDIIEKVTGPVIGSGVPSDWLSPVEAVFQKHDVQLSEAYWLWMRDQAYEGQVMGRDGEDACSPISSGTLTFADNVELADNQFLDKTLNLDGLTSEFRKIDPQWGSNSQRDISVNIQMENGQTESFRADLRAKAYVGGKSGCDENGRTGLQQTIVDVSGDDKIYVLVSNISTDDTQFRTSLEIAVEVPPPRSLEAQSRDASAELNWESPKSPPSSFTGGYNVYRSTSEFEDPSEATLAGEEIAESAFTDTGLENGQTYYYRVTAVYEAEEGTNLPFESDPSPQVEVKPLPDPPNRP